MKYIECCKHYKSQIIESFEPAYSIDNFFTDDEIKQLTLYQFQNSNRIKMQNSSSNIQPIVDMSILFKDLDFLKSKCTDVFGKFADEHTGNFFITNRLHDIHVDLIAETEASNPWYDNLIPYKSVIIPLFLTKDETAHTTFMEQRRIGYSVIFDRDFLSPSESSIYEIQREYTDLIDINGNQTDPNIDLNQWSENKYPQITKNNFIGFSEESILEQRVGSLIVFDSCQIHASCDMNQKPYNWLKNAINIQFYKEHTE
jgi:hypothetical protein